MLSCKLVRYPVLNFSPTFEDDLSYHFAEKHSDQNLSLLSSKNFVVEIFRDFMLYDNKQTLKVAFLSKQLMLIQKISSTNWNFDNQGVDAFMSIFFGAFWTWKSDIQSFQLRNGKLQRKSGEQKTWSNSQQIRTCSEKKWT